MPGMNVSVRTLALVARRNLLAVLVVVLLALATKGTGTSFAVEVAGASAAPATPVTEAVAAVKFSTGTPRRHFSLSPASAHPTSATKLSKNGCWLEKFPVGSKVPQDRTAARKRPSLSPPFVTICAPTENPPALGPQLYAHCGVRETGLT